MHAEQDVYVVDLFRLVVLGGHNELEIKLIKMAKIVGVATDGYSAPLQTRTPLPTATSCPVSNRRLGQPQVAQANSSWLSRGTCEVGCCIASSSPRLRRVARVWWEDQANLAAVGKGARSVRLAVSLSLLQQPQDCHARLELSVTGAGKATQLAQCIQ